MMELRFYSRRKHYAWLSNFSRHGFDLDGRRWATVEHFFQAMKFRSFVRQEEIRWVSHPAEAKRLGGLSGIRENWDVLRELVMRTALRAKFSLEFNPDLVRLLKNTEGYDLIEDSPIDYYWGCGRDNTGKNRLGCLLVELRSDPALGQTPPMIEFPEIPPLIIEEDLLRRCQASIQTRSIPPMDYTCKLFDGHLSSHQDGDATWT